MPDLVRAFIIYVEVSACVMVPRQRFAAEHIRREELVCKYRCVRVCVCVGPAGNC